MDRDEAVARIKFDLGRRTDLTDEIIQRMQDTQTLLEQGRSLPWFLKVSDQSLVVPTGSALVSFPTRFLREDQLDPFHFTDSDTGDVVYLEKVTTRVGRQRFATEDDGRPIAYAIDVSAWRFFPARDQNYTLTYTYYQAGTSLATNATDNAWLVNAPSILIGLVGSQMAEILGHDKAKARFDGLYKAAWTSAFGETVEREVENAPQSMGSEL